MTKVAVITGASSGIGKAAAVSLAAQGWHVIAHGRDARRSAAAEADIKAAATGRVNMVRGDLGELADAAGMAGEIAAFTDHIDVLINNAGGMRADLAMTSEGNEATFAGNHLGHFLLTTRLMPLLRAAGHARIVNTTSDGHFYCPGVDWDDPQALRDWSSGGSYCLVKLYNILFTRELARRLAGDGIVAHALHPGTVASNFVTHAGEQTKAHMATLAMQTPVEAAQPLVWLATSVEAGELTGLYWNRAIAEEPAPAARDPETAKRLRTLSEDLIAGS